jgi:hypothetical protein
VRYRVAEVEECCIISENWTYFFGEDLKVKWGENIVLERLK